ncbi:MAG TPA: YwiC-like family protein [Bryobacteraceae bacterium]|nr:YwiC-like family protein [Bryobacteraceae bacterium]
MATPPQKPKSAIGRDFLPREHGATAMLLTPFLSAAILARQVRWPELGALVAIVCALAIKDPLVVIARQRLVWKQEHSETRTAMRYAAIESVILAGSGLVLVAARGWVPFLPLFLGAGFFTVLAVMINVRNRQRSEWFQVASAAALTSTSLVACISVRGSVADWCWWLWLLCALQAAAGIFVVHARLDAMVAARKGQTADGDSRRAALLSQAVLIVAALFFAFRGRFWIAAALMLAATCYLMELRRQRLGTSLQIPLKRVGQRALALSTIYALMIVAGLW